MNLARRSGESGFPRPGLSAGPVRTLCRATAVIFLSVSVVGLGATISARTTMKQKANARGGTSCPGPIKKEAMLDALRELRKSGRSSFRGVIASVKDCGVAFDLTPEVEKELASAGATPALVQAVREYRRLSSPEKAPVSTPTPKPPPDSNPMPKPPPDSNLTGPPFYKDQLIEFLRAGKSSATVESYVEARGAGFVATPDAAVEILNAGGDQALIGAIAANPRQPVSVYDEMIALADEETRKHDFKQAVELLQQAARLDPSRPGAYQHLFDLYLYFLQKFDLAEQNARAAIDRGGQAEFRVRQLSNSNPPEVTTGRLLLTRRKLIFELGDGGRLIDEDHSQIRGLTAKQSASRPVLEIQVQQARDGKGLTYQFASWFNDPLERDLIEKLIHAYRG